MKVICAPTEEMHEHEHLPCRVWKGVTDKGTEVELIVAAIVPLARGVTLDNEVPSFMKRTRDVPPLSQQGPLDLMRVVTEDGATIVRLPSDTDGVEIDWASVRTIAEGTPEYDTMAVYAICRLLWQIKEENDTPLREGQKH